MLGLGKKASPKWRARVALVSGAAVAALGFGAIGAGTAAAAPSCTGLSITGQGASLQKVAQQTVWGPTFESSICNKGTFPKITYNSTGSGGGLKEWNHDGKRGSINTALSWISTDDAPTAEQIGNITSVAGGSDLLTIPVAQTAIVAIVNPPAGCTVEQLTNKDLEYLFRGNKKNWSAVETAEGSCNSPVTRVVRLDGSGTTYQFKNYLSRMNSSKLPCVNMTWAELRPITNGETGAPNTTWPTSCEGTTLSPLVKPAANGNGEVVKKVNVTDGSIAYTALPDAMANKTADSTVVALQNNGQVPAAEATYGAAASGEKANCSATKYEVPVGARYKAGEPAINVDWSQVFGAQPTIKGTAFPLCTLTYALAFTKYKNAGFKFGQYRTVYDYLKEYITNTATGQANIDSNYYAKLPTGTETRYNVIGAAGFAAGKIRYE